MIDDSRIMRCSEVELLTATTAELSVYKKLLRNALRQVGFVKHSQEIHNDIFYLVAALLQWRK